ncbi:MAG TPA: lipid-binding SYLF domain-containing protein [Tepidisphaeraceae bacterium]|nr:lipid-binding SYLF domain-containing protein [Tepidisphaeraceae bacterium]
MRTCIFVAAALSLALLMGCRTSPKTAEGKEDLRQAAERAMDRMTAADPGLQNVVDKAHAHAIFPKVGKGGLIAGGAYGRGIVYEQGRMIGYADLTQATIGLQAGGQTYSELIVFQNNDALDRFRTNQLEFSANASAIAIRTGVAAAPKYENGVAVYVMPRAGLMAEASIGGQKFTFVSADTQAATRPAQ